MKKYFYLLLCSLVSIVFALSSCNVAEARLKTEIEGLKSSTPIFVEPGLQITDMFDEGGRVVIVYEYVDALYDFSEVTKADFTPDASDEDIRYMIETFVEANRDYVLRFTNKRTKEFKDFVYPLAELKEMLASAK